MHGWAESWRLLPALVLAALSVPALWALHLAFWGWVYRIRADSDEVLAAVTQDGWRLHVERYRPATPRLLPVVLCHGLAANRYNLAYPGPHSLAARLRARGHEVFVCDLRGNGASTSRVLARSPARFFDTPSVRPPPDAHAIDFDAHLLLDAPAVLELALRTSGQPRALWVGHSMGGMLGLALAQGEHAAKLAGVVAIASPTRWIDQPYLHQVTRWGLRLCVGRWLRQRWLLRLVAPYLGYVTLPLGDVTINPKNIEGAVLRRVAFNVLGDISKPLLAQFASWIDRDAWDTRSPAIDLRAGLARIRCPVQLLGGSADPLAPPSCVEGAFADLGSADKSLVILGRDRGDREEYGHGDLVFGTRAPEEVFPHIDAWLERHG